MLTALVRYNFRSIVACLVIFSSPVVQACEFCAAPALTLSEQIANAQIALLVDWQAGREAEIGDVGSASYTIRQVVAGEKAEWEVGRDLQQAGYVAAQKGEQFLLLGQVYEQEISWQPPVRMPPEVFQYVRQAPASTEPIEVRLAYFWRYIEHENVDIRNDAFGEFAKAPYEKIRLLSKLYSPKSLREWLVNDESEKTRRGLYGLMLGLCGDEQDAQFLRAQILMPSEGYRLGIDGLMAGYLLLAGEQGLQELTRAKLQEGNDAELHALMSAMRFHATYRSPQLSQQVLNVAMRQMLSNARQVDLVIVDLARGNDWEAMDQVAAIYSDSNMPYRSTKLTVIRYFLTAEFATDEEITQLQRQQAATILKRLEEQDPKLVSDARRQLY